jgi:hypothetical protein
VPDPFLNYSPWTKRALPASRLGLTGFDAVYSYGSWQRSLRKLIHLFKYDKICTPDGRWRVSGACVPREERFDAVADATHWRRPWSALQSV